MFIHHEEIILDLLDAEPCHEPELLASLSQALLRGEIRCQDPPKLMIFSDVRPLAFGIRSKNRVNQNGIICVSRSFLLAANEVHLRAVFKALDAKIRRPETVALTRSCARAILWFPDLHTQGVFNLLIALLKYPVFKMVSKKENWIDIVSGRSPLDVVLCPLAFSVL